ncbi:MAG: hypothetical protein AB7P21_22920 [Lautropia sp.]
MPDPRATNPRVSRLLIGVTWVEVAVLIVAGGGLLLAMPTVVGVWPWSLAPYNLRFLGGLYTAALVAAYLQSSQGGWAPGRVVTTMIFVFTLVVSVLSVVHLGRFEPLRAPSWIWFVLYVGVCVNAGVHLLYYRRLPVVGAAPSGTVRAALLAQAFVLGTYGLALLVATEFAARLWPWKIDTFHAQLYSVAFLAPAAGALALRRAAARIDWATLGLTQLAWGALPIVALVVVDRQARRVVWTDWPVWGWIALFATITAMGGWMLSRARANPRRTPPS